MINVSAEFKKSDIDNVLKNFSGSLVRKAVRSALDKTGTWGKNYLGDEIAKEYKLTSSKVRKAMRVKRTTQTKLSAELITEGTALPLIDNFKPIQDSVGVTTTISPGWIKRTPHAFINKAGFKKKSGKAGSKDVIMLRVGKKRYPTTGKAGYGPPIPALLGRTKILSKAKIKINDHLYKELADQIAKRSLQQAAIVEIE